MRQAPLKPRRWKALALALLALLLVAPVTRAQDPIGVDPAPATSSPTTLTAEHTLSRVAFIGASVSAGFGNARELKVGRSVPLGEFFKGMLASGLEGSDIHDFGSSQFFTAPIKSGQRQVEQALEQRPTLVVGIDYLFWYAFGYPRRSNPRRFEGLQMGLKRLEDIPCQLIIGDLPNVDHALLGKSPLRGGGAILQKGQLPSEAERVRMNKVIYEWAAQRKQVQVFPLADLMQRMVAGEKMELQGNEWKVESLDQILQEDLLHPRTRGMVWVALYVAESTLQLPGVDKRAFEWSEASIRERLWQSLEPARAKQTALEARRKARRAKRDKKAAEAAEAKKKVVPQESGTR
jgi:hypothetical protein